MGRLRGDARGTPRYVLHLRGGPEEGQLTVFKSILFRCDPSATLRGGVLRVKDNGRYLSIGPTPFVKTSSP
jgi:hypothetical protein